VDPDTHEAALTEAPADDVPAVELPLAFRCAIWVPVFSVLLFFMLRIFGPRPIVVPPRPGGPAEPRPGGPSGPEADEPGPSA
jgi:hypothetical protein